MTKLDEIGKIIDDSGLVFEAHKHLDRGRLLKVVAELKGQIALALQPPKDEEEDTPIVMISPAFIQKTESISEDIKIYVNSFALPNTDTLGPTPTFDPETIQELINLRKGLKKVIRKMKDEENATHQ